jgi:dephospho-CoA kinase
VAPAGRVDRDAVARLVFDDPDGRRWLEEYLWPRVGSRIGAWRSGLDSLDPRPRAAVVEVPLLFESGMEDVFDHTIAVIADDDLRADRIGTRGHAGVASRESRQLDQLEKAERADFAVRNDGTVDELERELSQVLGTMRL